MIDRRTVLLGGGALAGLGGSALAVPFRTRAEPAPDNAVDLTLLRRTFAPRTVHWLPMRQAMSLTNNAIPQGWQAATPRGTPSSWPLPPRGSH